MRTLNAAAALLFVITALAGCIAGPADDVTDGTDAGTALEVPEVPLLDGTMLVEEIQRFSEAFPKRNANGPNHEAARNHLHSAMAGAGLTVVRQGLEAPPSRTSTPTNVDQDGYLENIIGIKWGVETDSWIVIGGHYDVTDGAIYGAYDDGSGTIMTLELAKAFALMDTQKTIAFTMFDGEEQGLRGSAFMMESIIKETFPETLIGADSDLEKVDFTPEIFAMIDLDMFGINYPAEAPIYFDDNEDTIRAFVDDVRKDIGIPDDKFKFQGITLGRSDYAPFEDAGVPVAFFISSFEENCPMSQCLPAGVAYPFWHQADTVEGMEIMAGGRGLLEDGFTNAARLSSELLHHLATMTDLTLEIREA